MKVLIVVACVLAAAAATPGLIGAPVAYSAPVAAAAVVAPSVSSQYHAQDELGQFSYGYQGPLSAKQEVRTADGITRGGYSYVDAHGLVQSAQYVSDPVNGFRVAATNLPVGPGVPAPPAPLAPVAVAAAPSPPSPPPRPSSRGPLTPPRRRRPRCPSPTPRVAAAKAAPSRAHARRQGRAAPHGLWPALQPPPIPPSTPAQPSTRPYNVVCVCVFLQPPYYGRKKRSPACWPRRRRRLRAPPPCRATPPVAYAPAASRGRPRPVAYARPPSCPPQLRLSTVAVHAGRPSSPATPAAVVVA
ncbi:Cuticle protein 6 [Gryllus bimaculatus]|nr:Cuticle protein 6 [Gryllus bimaculatus]